MAATSFWLAATHKYPSIPSLQIPLVRLTSLRSRPSGVALLPLAVEAMPGFVVYQHEVEADGVSVTEEYASYG